MTDAALERQPAALQLVRREPAERRRLLGAEQPIRLDDGRGFSRVKEAREREGVQLGESPDERGQVCDGRQLSMTLEITQCFRA